MHHRHEFNNLVIKLMHCKKQNIQNIDEINVCMKEDKNKKENIQNTTEINAWQEFV